MAKIIILKNISLFDHHIICLNGSSYLFFQTYLIPIERPTYFVCSIQTHIHVWTIKKNRLNVCLGRWTCELHPKIHVETIFLGQTWDELFSFKKNLG